MHRSEPITARPDLSSWFTDAVQRLSALERHVTTQFHEIEQREQQVGEREHILGERETVIATGERELARQRLALAERTQQLDTRDATLRELDIHLQQEREQNEQIQAQLTEQSRRLGELAAQLEKQEKDWEARQGYLSECEQAINRFQQAFESMFAENLGEMLGLVNGHSANGQPGNGHSAGAVQATAESDYGRIIARTDGLIAGARADARSGDNSTGVAATRPPVVTERMLANLAGRTRAEVERIMQIDTGHPTAGPASPTAASDDEQLTLLETPNTR